MNPVKPAAFRFRPFSRRQKQVLTWWCSASPVQAADGLIADGSFRQNRFALPQFCAVGHGAL